MDPAQIKEWLVVIVLVLAALFLIKKVSKFVITLIFLAIAGLLIFRLFIAHM